MSKAQPFIFAEFCQDCHAELDVRCTSQGWCVGIRFTVERQTSKQTVTITGSGYPQPELVLRFLQDEMKWLVVADLLNLSDPEAVRQLKYQLCSALNTELEVRSLADLSEIN